MSRPEPSGETSLERGESASWAGSRPEEWLELHGDELYAMAFLRCQDGSLAEDVVQETLLAAFGARDRFQGRSSERTWLIGILRHKVVDALRRRAREVPAPPPEPGDEALDALFGPRGRWRKPPEPWSVDPARLQEDAEFWRVVRRCVGELPGRLGQGFTLRVLDGYDSQEVCKALETTPTNLWMILHRARLRLRQCLESHWFGRRD